MNRTTEHRVLLINGPPRAGKDTAASCLHFGRKYVKHTERFSNPLKNSITSWIGVHRTSHEEMNLELSKDLPHEQLSGLSYREAQIDLSEKYLKPLYGKDCFGRWLLHRVQATQRYHDLIRADLFTIIPDSGFAEEARAIVEYMPADRIALMQVHRPGTDFSKDSRSYIEVPGLHTITLRNDGTQEVFEFDVIKAVTDWIAMTS